ncbi:unnamed protein product [Brassica rapa]|uniref:Uncharacterized protein n=1 Tax=Brassica campestris TaxID=3711 RepID=A0A8D9G6D7_BRACM|nr:unnamed protein product [Brassica rapa]
MCTDGQPRTSCVCADGHTQTATDVLCVLTDTHERLVYSPRGPKTQTVHGKGQRAESKDQRADMCTDGQPRTKTDTHGHTLTATDVLCALNTQPTWAKITRRVHGKGQPAESKDSVLISVLMDSHGRPVCADGHTRTATDVLCVLTDSHRQPRMSCVYWRTPTDVLCLLNRQPT